jgi:putative RNA 2'-phosphotransferase
MKRTNEESLSRHLSFLLRHSADFVNEAGWAEMGEVVVALTTHSKTEVTEKQVREIVAADAKGRYQIERGQVRAVQGHSHPVDLGLVPAVPPAILYHGTVEKFLWSILAQGLIPKSRTHVHLSESVAIATQVGERRGEAIILTIDAAKAHAEGTVFYQAANGVWLSSLIRPQYISQ